jgi:hypothetical protein
MRKSIRVAVAGLILAVIAVAGGCHDGYSTYRLGVSADYRWNDHHHGHYHRPHCPPPRHHHHRWH